MKIMVMDTHASSRERMVNLIKGQPDIEIVGDENPGSDMVGEALSNTPDIILMSASLFEQGGKEVMGRILLKKPETAFVIIAASDDPDLLLSVIGNGGKGFLPKNISGASLLRSLYAVERGEIAISRSMVRDVFEELQKISKAAFTKENEKLKMLTFRELEVLRLLASEASNHEIGRELFISNNTVRVHVHNILEKLQTSNRREAAKLAQRLSISTNGAAPRSREKVEMIKSK